MSKTVRVLSVNEPVKELTAAEIEQCKSIYESVGKYATEFKSLEQWETYFMTHPIEFGVWQQIAEAAALYITSRRKKKLKREQMTLLVQELMSISAGFIRRGKIYDCWKEVGGEVVVPVISRDEPNKEKYIIGEEGERFVDANTLEKEQR